DELPALDPKAYEAAARDRLADTWIQPGLPSTQAAAEPPAGAAAGEDPLRTAVANLHQAQELLHSRGARLAEIERALEEAHGARAGAEQRVAQLTAELITVRAAAGQQAGDLAAELAARERAQRALENELQETRARSTSYFESLQSTERHRSLFEGLLAELQEEIDTHESGRARLARELAGRDMRAAELESDLSQRAVRIAELDAQVATLGTALQQRDVELTRLRALEASLGAALEAARAEIVTGSTQAGEHEAALNEARTRVATLTAELAAERKRGAGLEEELGRVRSDMEQWAGAVQAAQAERSGHLADIASGGARAQQLEERVAEQVELLRTLQSASDAAMSRAREAEDDLRVAEEAIARLESQLRSRDSRVSELEKANQQWRHTLEEARAGHAETDAHEALRPALHTEAGEGAVREPAPDGATRLLIHTDGEREVVHVLGRKTSIGRTPDNDLQIDAKYVSRHHAVILAGPAHTIIEDLNSTNGVIVNGRRITRQVLNDGDQVTIGRAAYRFGVRRADQR
ncbi:MAG TPA: FHA domain-containing protein, partial [Steroidobacteraceae bacterium]|nr:FHA domain-containing protein [Steroidobacteraceae bacterium]